MKEEIKTNVISFKSSSKLSAEAKSKLEASKAKKILTLKNILKSYNEGQLQPNN